MRERDQTAWDERRSGYMRFSDGKVVRDDCYAVEALAEFLHVQLRGLILNTHFPCIAARSAFNAGAYRFGVFGEMASALSTKRLARHLQNFVAERPSMESPFATYIATFLEPACGRETDFEAALWAQLQAMRDIDEVPHDPAVSPDPRSPHFSYSVAGKASFVVGLHPASSRWGRRFAWPTLVFNLHEQFQELRRNGTMPRFQQSIRARDMALQGTTNPNLADFGEQSEARQYSGRAVGPDWCCPFAQGQPPV